MRFEEGLTTIEACIGFPGMIYLISRTSKMSDNYMDSLIAIIGSIAGAALGCVAAIFIVITGDHTQKKYRMLLTQSLYLLLQTACLIPSMNDKVSFLTNKVFRQLDTHPGLLAMRFGCLPVLILTAMQSCDRDIYITYQF